MPRMSPMNFQETKNWIIKELKEYKDENIEDYEWDTPDGVDAFLFDFTNCPNAWDLHFNEWYFNNDIVFECIDYINECYNDMCGEDIPINYFNSELKIQNQMIYWVGYELRQELLEEIDSESDEDIIKDYDKIIPDYVIVAEVA